MKKTTALTVLMAACLFAFHGIVYPGSVPSREQLCKKMIDLSGWQADKCEWSSFSQSAVGQMIEASRNYTKRNQALHVMLVSGMKAMAMWAPFATGLQMENNTTLIKTEKIKGYTTGITFDKQEKKGSIVVLLFKNSQASDPRAIFMVNFENMSVQKGLELAKKFDWEGMAALFAH